MFYIWGKNTLPRRMYELLSEDEKKTTCFVDTNPRSWGTTIGSSAVVGPKDLDTGKIEKILVPLYGVPLEKGILRNLRKSGIGYDKIWLMDERTLELELKENGSLQAMIQKGTVPYIRFLEFEVTHHCNLNCKGCSHFSPLSEKSFGDFDQFSKDLERIHSMVDHVGQIRLMGGEPLLNEDLWKFVEKTREIYKYDDIAVVSNGIKLIGISDKLKDTMRRCNAHFSVTLYPPVREFSKNMLEQLKSENISCGEAKSADVFGVRLNPDGNSDKEAVEFMCGDSILPLFEAGRISKCSISHKIPVYEKHFGMEHYPHCSIDIYDKDLTPAGLFGFITEPVEMCAYCGQVREFTWDKAGSDPKPEDWVGAGKIDTLPGFI